MTERKSYNLYHNLGYWFLSFIVLAFAGFYYTYFVVFFETKVSIIHIHFALMTLWIATLISQPFLIKYKKLAAHRMIGKLSYLVVPGVLISTFLMMRHGYSAYTNKLSNQLMDGVVQYSLPEVKHLAAKGFALPFVYFFWLGLFYLLAVINRKRTPVHARYMVAAAITILGPTLDRILFFALNIHSFPLNIPIETFAFLMIDVILIILLLKDHSQKQSTKTVWVCLAVYAISQTCYFIVQDENWWTNFVAFIMSPEL